MKKNDRTKCLKHNNNIRYATILMVGFLILCINSKSIGRAAEVDSQPGESEQQAIKSNPHAIGCRCHPGDPKKGADVKQTLKLSIESHNVNLLCYRCHKFIHIHPAGMDPKIAGLPIKVPQNLPLGLKGETEGKIVCTTCHDIHADKWYKHLLRGFSEEEKGQEPVYKKQVDLCYSCHGEDLLDPHKADQPYVKECQFCHILDPEIEKDIGKTLRTDLTKRCDFCHDNTRTSCSLAVKPYTGEKLQKQIPTLSLSKIGGDITCVSCHQKYRDSDGKHSLKSEYAQLLKQADKIDIHQTGIFCFYCHTQEPKEGGEINLKFQGDTIKVCIQCHDNKRARKDIHPVGITPPKKKGVKVPEEFPLYDGKITCATCHTLMCQAHVINPKFVRGGPYEERTDACFNCHVREDYAKLNPHIMIDKDGKIMDSSCHYCHTFVTDGEQRFGYKGALGTYCIGCHPEAPHPARSQHTNKLIESIWGNIELSERLEATLGKALIIFPLTIDGRIMCCTCHDPHMGAKGLKLRVTPQDGLCGICHIDKGGGMNR